MHNTMLCFVICFCFSALFVTGIPEDIKMMKIPSIHGDKTSHNEKASPSGSDTFIVTDSENTSPVRPHRISFTAKDKEVDLPLWSTRDRKCGDGLCYCSRGIADCSNRVHGLTYVPLLPPHTYEVRLINDSITEILPEDFFINVTGIRSLSLSKNNLRHVNAMAFQPLTQLRALYLDYNTALDYKGIANLTSMLNLTKFSCNACGLGPLPQGFFVRANLQKLTNLAFHDNNIGDVKMSEFRDASELRDLALSNNSITTFTVDLVSDLEKLNLDQNKLSDFPLTCSSHHQSFFPSLTNLSLVENLITAIPEHVCLDKLAFLQLTSNRISTLPSFTFSSERFPRLTELYMYNMDFPAFSDFTIRSYAFNNSVLWTLNLFNNNLELRDQRKVSADSFANCPNLTTLELSRNFLTITEDRFLLLLGHVEHLETLYLEECMITNISAAMFARFPLLQRLSLNRNSISYVPDAMFDGLRHLQHLDLGHNQIALLSPAAFTQATRSRLKSLDLSRNPFLCSCDMMWLRDWMLSEPALFRRSKDLYQCSNLHALNLTRLSLSPQACLLSHQAYQLIVATVSIFIILFSVATLVYRYRWHVRLVLYEAFRGQREVRRRRLATGSFDYDVFVCYDQHDLRWVKEQLMPELEGRLGLKLCVHQRDFVLGNLIVDNIARSVQRSKKVLMVFSTHFAKSQWCQFELSFCLRHTMDNDDNLLIVRLDDPSSRDLTSAMMAVLTTTTYVQWGGSDRDAAVSFWGRLEIALQEILHSRQIQV